MYKIIIDSCGEIPEELAGDKRFVNVPLTLRVGDKEYIDDETFDRDQFIADVEASPVAPTSACPSPEAYLAKMDEEVENIYIITLSAQLSGSYNSAIVARDMFLEDHPNHNVYVIDSRSASVGETLLGMKVASLEDEGKSFEEVCACVDEYRESQHTFFVLDTLETLRKAGRISSLKAGIASTLNIIPVMGSTAIGSIQQLANARGIKRALGKMAKCVQDVTEHTEEKVLAIAHCNCISRALEVKEMILANSKFKDVFIVNTSGVSTMYANKNGIIVVA